MSTWKIKKLDSEGNPIDPPVFEYKSDSGQQKFGGDWGNPDLYIHVECTEEEETTKAQEEKWAKLRAIRDIKLADVDKARYNMVWAEQTDSPWTQEEKDAWVEYRQALLDVPASVEDIDALDIDAFSWPTKP